MENVEGDGTPFANGSPKYLRGKPFIERSIALEKKAVKPCPTVLVVDDDRLIITMVQDLLVSNGYRVVTAGNGKAGLAQAQREKPDLIILDLMMPEMDGFEVTRQLRQDPEFRHLPIIILTSIADSDAREKALRNGADSYMIKPVNARLLLIQIRSLLLLRPRHLSQRGEGP
jgi:CheY-like chemotaxis protein